ncbi:putative flavoprotein involved in K+ transport [Amycolatopsis marina]|uniref:Putative flavoprotein involved in K+ transport n=1 Tax=Amycolatopsis marina TaxID=490629 RepID=A0A1I1AX89_9PSEU|nr:NAD(P)/FAD-dependent oxidoreductase [Amycolatopsis marina]SFB42705.1 putative flavoprotein involved in K+ transport [Amycolatopsis marina]
MTDTRTEVVVIGAGQSGLTAAHTLTTHGLTPLVLEAGPEPTGSWPRYYDSLTVFSPAQYATMPGLDFPADPDHYPHRDEVVAYLRRYAAGLDADIRTNTAVTAVRSDEERGFLVHTAHGETIHAAGVVAATGSFGHPHTPVLPGQEQFTGRVLHVADYRNPKHHVGERIVVVGAGNSAVQVAYELAEVAEVSLATRSPLAFVPQRRDGHDLHHWLDTSGFDHLPPEWLIRYLGGNLVLDTGDYRDALTNGRMQRRPMFTAFDHDAVVWAEGTRERVDTVLFATGYRPHLDYLTPLGGLDDNGLPRHSSGVSVTHPGLVYLGLEFQRTFSSNTLRGVHRDAEHVIPALLAHVANAPAAIGL